MANQTLELYLAGCTRYCDKCHSPETWDFNQGLNYQLFIPKLIEKIIEYPNMIKSIWILGGEPLDQNLLHLKTLIDEIKKFNLELWLFTSYELNQVPSFILNELDYIKTGKYDNTKLGDNVQYGIKLASINQNITKL